MDNRKKELKKQMEDLKRLREITGMNRTDFSIYMGIPRRTLEDWEGGRRKAPDYVIRMIAYQVNMERFLKRNHIEYKEEVDEYEADSILMDEHNEEEEGILRAVNQYTEALTLLDQYDHQCLSKPKGITPVYRITYDDCMNMVAHMRNSFETDVFGVEKEVGKVNGIIAAIYQSAFGQDAYPSLEEKAANLLYFMIKDHPFADGCKRIAASLFLEFLERNHELYLNGRKRIGDGELVAITLMIAESNPEEKDTMVKLVMNLLNL